MSRGRSTTPHWSRCLAVWGAAGLGLVATWWLASGAAASLASPDTWRGGFEDLLVAVCAVALLACATRLWVVTTATTLGLVRGRLPQDAHGLTRRLVLAACGAAVVAGVSSPALAGGSGGSGDLERLAGLPLPDRATASSAARPAASQHPVSEHPVTEHPAAGRPAVVRAASGADGEEVDEVDEVVVRAGDSLWSLAADRLPRWATTDEIDRAWRAVYAANRAEIGDDPGLIVPGQRLRLPGTTDAQGER